MILRRVPCDPRLQATVLRSVPLRYRTGADPSGDRSGHVRAGSAVTWYGGRLVVVQDDSAFLALVDPADLTVDPLPLPVEPPGTRHWDERSGNKHLKPDLEAAVAVGRRLIAFGSGSTPERERVLVVSPGPGAALRASWVAAPALYASLRSAAAFSGSQLNVEAAALVGDAVRLFNRGNGAPRDGRQPVDATCDLDRDALLAYLDGGADQSPSPREVVTYDLGTLGGARLGFTGAAEALGGVLFCAAAEASPDTYHDGPVTGSAVGYIRGTEAGWAVLAGADGRAIPAKAEGIALSGPGRSWVIVDPDDPERPAELCEVELRGHWV